MAHHNFKLKPDQSRKTIHNGISPQQNFVPNLHRVIRCCQKLSAGHCNQVLKGVYYIFWDCFVEYCSFCAATCDNLKLINEPKGTISEIRLVDESLMQRSYICLDFWTSDNKSKTQQCLILPGALLNQFYFISYYWTMQVYFIIF